MKQSLLLLLFYMLVTSSVFAQLTNTSLNKQLQGKNNYYSLEETVRNYFNAERKRLNKSEVLPGEKKYYRWLYDLRNNINPDGTLISNADALRLQADKNLQQQRTSGATNGAWYNIGYINATNTNSGTGMGRVDRIAFHPTDPNIMYAATPNGGIFKTTDGGTSWNALPDYSPVMGVTDIVVDRSNGNTIYAVSGNADNWFGGFVVGYGYGRKCNGVYKSTDGGATWYKTSPLGADESNSFFYGFHMVQHPTAANTFLVATSLGLYRTTDGGDNWQEVKDVFAWDAKYKLNDGQTIFLAESRVMGSGERRSYFVSSQNGGSSWSDHFFDGQDFTGDFDTCSRFSIALTPADYGKVYILEGKSDTISGSCDGFTYMLNYPVNTTAFGTGSTNLFASDANGDNNYDQSVYDHCIAASPTNATTILTGGAIIFRIQGLSPVSPASVSDYFYNAGAPSRYVHPDIHDIRYHPLTNEVFACTDGGIWKSANDGTTWTFAGEGIVSSQFYHSAATDEDPNYLLGGLQDNGTHFRKTNNSLAENVFGCDGFDVAIDWGNKNTIYFTCNSFHRRRNSAGSSYNMNTPGDNAFFGNLALHTSDRKKLYIGKTKLYASADSGATFSLVNPNAYTQFDIETCPSNSQRIYIAGFDTTNKQNIKQLWRTDNEGSNWTALQGNAGFPANASYSSIKSIAVHPANSSVVVVTLGGFQTGLKVFYSSNAGASWTNISYDLPNVPVNSATIRANGDIYVGTDNAVYFIRSASVLTGEWVPFYTGLPRVPITKLLVNENIGRIRAATFGRGWYETNLPDNTCPVTVAMTGTLTGQRLYESGNALTSTATVTGGNATEVVAKSANFVDMIPGTLAEAGSNFKAIIGPCESGTGHLFRSVQQTDENFDPEHSRLLAYEQNGLTGGLLRNVSAKENVFTADIAVMKPGKYEIKIVDAAGRIILSVMPEKAITQESYYFETSKQFIAGKKYYALLFFNGSLVHFQEFMDTNR